MVVAGRLTGVGVGGTDIVVAGIGSGWKWTESDWSGWLVVGVDGGVW